ncbi:MAG: type III-B CRISPR module-associated protein Cmr3 [Chloroflexota bacterium]
MTAYFMEAQDVLFFRDGRPFNAGDDHHAVSRFPPPPSVIQGVIRSHYLLHKGVPLEEDKIRQAVGDAENFNGLRLSAPLLARREPDGRLTRFFPTPADACLSDDGQRIRARQVVSFRQHSHAARGLTHLLVSPPNSKPQKGDLGGYLDESSFQAYFLNGQAVATVKAGQLFQREVRVGIALDAARRSTESGKLYEAEFIRPQEGVGIWVEMDGYPDFPQQGVMRAGGEGRALRYSAVARQEFAVQLGWKTDQPLPPNFKVYFASPAYFGEGWKPKDWGVFFDGQVELVTAAIGGYEVIGGYDLLEGKQKPAARWLPAGSVFYFRSQGSVRLKSAALTERGAEIGYGQVVIGAWQPVDA